MTKPQTHGREKNAAQPLGERGGVISHRGTEKTGRKSTSKAGPDGPSAAAVGSALKKP